MSKRIAVTGSRGRLAPGLVHHLSHNGYVVETFSRVAGDGHDDIAKLVDPGVLEEFDDIVHLSWSSVPVVAEQKPGVEETEDFPLARAMAGAASLARKPPRIVFFSTAAVYGNTGEEPADESSVCRPLGRYASSKLRAEQILSESPRCAVLRITNVFGSDSSPARKQGIIPALVEACRSRSPVTLWGDGSAEKDYLAASDLYRGIHALLDSDLTGTYNIASGHVLSVNHLIAMVSRASGSEVPVKRIARYPWDVERARVSAELFRRSTGWCPSVDPESFIARLVGP